MQITILNTPEELKSFPLKQSLKLRFEEAVEDSQLQDCISLIRLTNQTGLFNISQMYNQSLGYIREKFDTESINIVGQIQLDGSYIVTITPVKPLSPGFEYTLFVDKILSSEYLELAKIVSKSSSKISVLTPDSPEANITLEVISEPLITSTSNIVKVLLTNNVTNISKTYTLDLKSNKNKIKYESFTFMLNSTVYVSGEKFELLSTGYNPLNNHYYFTLKASITEDIVPIETEEHFKSISNQDILDYYNNLNNLPSTFNTTSNNNINLSSDSIKTSVVGMNKLLITLPNSSEFLTSDLDFNNITFNTSEAFGMYTLSMLGLYDDTKQYEYTYSIKDDYSFYITISEV